MELRLNKKGILFTIMSVMISSLIIMMFAANQTTPLDSKVKVYSDRINDANQFLINLESYSSSALKVSGYQALRSMIDHIKENDFLNSIQDINISFRDCVLDGEFSSESSANGPCKYMSDLTIQEVFDKIVDLTNQELNYDLNMKVNNVWIDQVSPFSVKAYMDINYSLNYKDFNWTRDQIIISSDIPIQGLEDPLYKNVNFNDENKVVTFKETNIREGEFNLTTYKKFITNHEYMVSSTTIVESNLEPLSFFGRLTNNSNIKYQGTLTIISIINRTELNYKPTNVSYVDFYLTANEELDHGACNTLYYVTADPSKTLVNYKHLSSDFGFGLDNVTINPDC